MMSLHNAATNQAPVIPSEVPASAQRRMERSRGTCCVASGKTGFSSQLEMTMRNFPGEYVGARVPARAGVSWKWVR
jgi:hypothetical protein